MSPPDDVKLMAGAPATDEEAHARWQRLNWLLQYDTDLIEMATTRRRWRWLRGVLSDWRAQAVAIFAFGAAAQRFTDLNIITILLGG